MIKKITESEQLVEANCDCCGSNIPIKFGNISDHLRIGGYINGKLLDGIVCVACVEEKLGFIEIRRNENTTGYC